MKFEKLGGVEDTAPRIFGLDKQSQNSFSTAITKIGRLHVMNSKNSTRILCVGVAVLLFASQWVAIAEDKKSPVKIGGALRVGYTYGTYGGEDNPHRRGENIGDADLEIFRLNADVDYNNVISRLEYRWYDNYSMIHTAWLGYNLGELGTVKAGVVRVSLWAYCLWCLKQLVF